MDTKPHFVIEGATDGKWHWELHSGGEPDRVLATGRSRMTKLEATSSLAELREVASLAPLAITVAGNTQFEPSKGKSDRLEELLRVCIRQMASLQGKKATYSKELTDVLKRYAGDAAVGG